MNSQTFKETSYSAKEATDKLKASLNDLKVAKESNITTDQRERLDALEKAIPKAIKDIKGTKKEIRLHELLEKYQ